MRPPSQAARPHTHICLLERGIEGGASPAYPLSLFLVCLGGAEAGGATGREPGERGRAGGGYDAHG